MKGDPTLDTNQSMTWLLLGMSMVSAVAMPTDQDWVEVREKSASIAEELAGGGSPGRASCLSGRKRAVDALAAVAQTAQRRLAQPDLSTEGREHEERKVQVAYDKSLRMLSEVELCTARQEQSPCATNVGISQQVRSGGEASAASALRWATWLAARERTYRPSVLELEATVADVLGAAVRSDAHAVLEALSQDGGVDAARSDRLRPLDRWARRTRRARDRAGESSWCLARRAAELDALRRVAPGEDSEGRRMALGVGRVLFEHRATCTRPPSEYRSVRRTLPFEPIDHDCQADAGLESWSWERAAWWAAVR